MGSELIDRVCQATGLPKEMIQVELTRILKEEGIEPDETTLNDIRKALANYLQDVLLNAKSEFS